MQPVGIVNFFQGKSLRVMFDFERFFAAGEGTNAVGTESYVALNFVWNMP